MIGAYDHSNTGFVGKLRSCVDSAMLFAPGADLADLDAVSSMRDCWLVICHVDDEAWSRLFDTKRAGVLLRVSSHGWGGMPGAVDPTSDSEGRLVLHLLPEAGAVEVEGWKRILETLELRENWRALAAGGNPNGIRRFFSRSGTEHLAALSILCQGYLAVAASADARILDVGSVREAYRAMGWLDYSDRPENAAAVENMAKEWSKVSTPRWWIECLRGEGGDTATVQRDLLSEWSGLAPQGAASENLETLLLSLGCRKSGEALENREATGGEISAQVVADVYLELGKILGGAAS